MLTCVLRKREKITVIEKNKINIYKKFINSNSKLNCQQVVYGIMMRIPFFDGKYLVEKYRTQRQTTTTTKKRLTIRKNIRFWHFCRMWLAFCLQQFALCIYLFFSIFSSFVALDVSDVVAISLPLFYSFSCYFSRQYARTQ